MELKNGVYIGNDVSFAESLVQEMKGVNIRIFPDGSENLDFFQTNPVDVIFLETATCAHDVEPYLIWLNQVIDTRKCIIILLAENSDR